ncbi:MAG TPA: hypothetical protein VFM62_01975 [Arthrobacter sp.]|nr:hypothetical protein [Arthrobacter sp.]
MDSNPPVLALLLGIPMIIVGCLAYAGRWRSWVTITGHNPRGKTYSGLGWLYVGIGLCMMSLTALLGPDQGVFGVCLVLAGVAGIWIGLMSWFWLPGFVRPSWVRAWEARGSDPREFPIRPLRWRRR